MAKIEMRHAARRGERARPTTTTRRSTTRTKPPPPSVAVLALKELLGRRWRAGKEWGNEVFALWNGQDYVAIRVCQDPPARGAERKGARTLVLNFWESTVIEHPEQVAQVVEWALQERAP